MRARNRVAQHAAPVVGRDDDRDERCRPRGAWRNERSGQRRADPDYLLGGPAETTAQSRYGMTSFSRGRRNLSGSAWSYGLVGRFTKSASSVPMLQTAWYTPAGIRSRPRSCVPGWSTLTTHSIDGDQTRI